MLGALLTILFALGSTGLGLRLMSNLLRPLDPAARLGVAGLFSLGLLGTALLFFGMASLLMVGVYVVAAVGFIGLGLLALDRSAWTGKKPEGATWAFVLVLSLCLLFAFVGALAPATTLEWDTLAYHLAVPKIWLAEGQISYIPFIHHSNFPFAVDNLYLLGLTWGGQAGAKAFSVMFLAFGLLALFGIGRQRYGELAGWWAALAFATVPVVLWLSGTAYIDVANGLYAGLGMLFAALLLLEPGERRYLLLAALSLGLAAGSKYTGLQTIFAVGLIVLVILALRGGIAKAFSASVTIAAIALVVASPWYVKNVLNVGNPVFPFFYERLGGKNWDDRRAAIYRNEQQTFGVGRTASGRDPGQLGHGILGLAYQPGRYVNPAQEQGGGFPFGAIGFPVLGAMLAWGFSGRARRFEIAILAMVGLSLLMWFFLSQQSRYIISLAVPLAVLLGGGASQLRAGIALAVGAGLQAAYSLWLINTVFVGTQLRVALGRDSAEDYQAANIGFYRPAQSINEQVKGGKVALYDEVFGYLLDVPYFWANPGHGTMIPYDSMSNGQDYVRGLRSLGITHVYVNFANPQRDPIWFAAMGIDGATQPMPENEARSMMENWEIKFVPLIADASANGLLQPVEVFRTGSGRPTGVLFRLAQ